MGTDLTLWPPEAVHAGKQRLVDAIACAAGAVGEPLCERIAATASLFGGTPPARIWGSGTRTSIDMAAFANGTAAAPYILQTNIKRHPACYYGQAAIDAALSVRGNLAGDEIAEVHIETYAAAQAATRILLPLRSAGEFIA